MSFPPPSLPTSLPLWLSSELAYQSTARLQILRLDNVSVTDFVLIREYEKPVAILHGLYLSRLPTSSAYPSLLTNPCSEPLFWNVTLPGGETYDIFRPPRPPPPRASSH